MEIDPWAITTAVTTICVCIIILQWITFRKKLNRTTSLLVEPQVKSGVTSSVTESPVVPSPVVQGPIAPSPITQGPVAPSLVIQSPLAPSPVIQSPVPPSLVIQSPVPPSLVIQSPVPPSLVIQSPVPPSLVIQSPVPPSPVVPSQVPAPKVEIFDSVPVKLPPLPEFFDQTFTDYGVQFGTPVVDRHRETHSGCRFIRRIIRNYLPKELVPAKSIAPFHDKFLYGHESTRIYYLHLPEGVYFNETDKDFTEYSAPIKKVNTSHQDKDHQYPVVIFIHDSDETCFDGEFIEHPNKTPSQSWLDLSDKEGIILVYAQARGQWASHKSIRRKTGDYMKSMWLSHCQDPNQLDQVYLEKIIDDLGEICSHQVDMKKIYVIGYVNGGFLATDVTFGCSVQSVEDGPYTPWMKYPLSAVCLYMGGITNYQMKKTLNIDKYKLPDANEIFPKCTNSILKNNNQLKNSHKPDVLVVTGDPEMFSCVHAVQCFYQMGFGVKVIRMDDRVQGYYPESTMEIWKFFQSSPHFVK